MARQIAPGIRTPLHTSLPTSPLDSQEINYLADAANGIIWRLRYRAASASAYKWEYVGGAEITAEVLAAETTTSTVYVDLATAGPAIVAPLAGDYDIRGDCSISWGVSDTFGTCAVKVGSAGTTDNDRVALTTGVIGASVGAGSQGGATIRRTVSAAATTIKLQYKNGNANQVTYQYRRLGIRPVRVG